MTKYKYPWLAELDEHTAELIQGAIDKGFEVRSFEYNPVRLFVRSSVGHYLPSGEYAVSVWSQQVGYTTPPAVWTRLVPPLDQDYIDRQVAEVGQPEDFIFTDEELYGFIRHTSEANVIKGRL